MPDSEQKIDPGGMVQTSIRLRSALKKQVERELVERDTSLQAAIERGLELWLANPPKQGEAADVNLPQPSEAPSALIGQIVVELKSYLDPILGQLKSISDDLKNFRENGRISQDQAAASDAIALQAEAESIIRGVESAIGRKSKPRSARSKVGKKASGHDRPVPRVVGQ